MLRSTLCVFLVIIAGLTSATCNAQIDETIENAAKTSHLLVPSPPLGFFLVRSPLVIEEKFIGFHTVLQKEGVIAKVVVRVDLREDADFTQRGWRSGGVKGYINGSVGSVVGSGYEVKDKSFPDIDGSDLTEEMRAEVKYENEDGNKLFSNQRIFFDTRGFSIFVIASDKEELENLVAWADQIKAIDAPKNSGN